MKIVKQGHNDALILTADGDSDKLLLSVIANLAEELCVVTEVSEQRVELAQRKVREVITAFAGKEEPEKTLLVRVASWMDKVLTKPKGAK